MSEGFLQYPDDGRWRDKASCKNVDNRLFFDFFQGNCKADDERLAFLKELCSKCPVKKECLDFAVRNGIQYGVWGGLLPKERKEIITQVSVMSDKAL